MTGMEREFNVAYLHSQVDFNIIKRFSPASTMKNGNTAVYLIFIFAPIMEMTTCITFVGLVIGLGVGWFVTMVVLIMLIRKLWKIQGKHCNKNYIRPAESLKHLYDTATEMPPRRPLPSTNALEPHSEARLGETGPYIDITDETYSEETETYIDIPDLVYSEEIEPYVDIPDHAYSVSCSRSMTNSGTKVCDLNDTQSENRLPSVSSLTSNDPENVNGDEADNDSVTVPKESDNHLVQGIYLENVRVANYTEELVYEGPDQCLSDS